MVLVTYCLAVISFCLAFYFTRLSTTCGQLIVIAKQAVTTITNKDLDDAAKEKETQAAAIDTLKNAFSLLMKLVAIFGAAVVPIWLADVAGIAKFSETSAFALRLDVLLITTIVASAIVLLGRKLSGKQ